MYWHLQSSGHSHCDRQLCVSELRGELQRLIGLLFMFVLLGLSGAKKSLLAFSNNFRHLFLIQIMIIFGYISKYNYIWHTKIQLITLRLHSPLLSSQWCVCFESMARNRTVFIFHHSALSSINLIVRVSDGFWRDSKYWSFPMTIRMTTISFSPCLECSWVFI